MDRHRGQQNLAMPTEDWGVEGLVPKRPGVSLVPTDEMRAAKAWLEKLEKPVRQDTELLAMHGWLSPEGKLYACGWKKHDELTSALGFAHESDIEAAGYCKLSQLKWLVQPRYAQQGINDAQWCTIEKWYQRNGFPEEHFMRLCALQ